MSRGDLGPDLAFDGINQFFIFLWRRLWMRSSWECVYRLLSFKTKACITLRDTCSDTKDRPMPLQDAALSTRLHGWATLQFASRVCISTVVCFAKERNKTNIYAIDLIENINKIYHHWSCTIINHCTMSIFPANDSRNCLGSHGCRRLSAPCCCCGAIVGRPHHHPPSLSSHSLNVNRIEHIF